jgi:cytochrome c-type biogenesis protein CcmH/NrfG
MERKIGANIAYGEGKYTQAESLLISFLHDYPHDKTAWEMLGNVRMKLGKIKLSECAFEMVKALEGQIR